MHRKVIIDGTYTAFLKGPPQLIAVYTMIPKTDVYYGPMVHTTVRHVAGKHSIEFVRDCRLAHSSL